MAKQRKVDADDRNDERKRLSRAEAQHHPQDQIARGIPELNIARIATNSESLWRSGLGGRYAGA